MAKPPAFQFYARDWLSSTLDMPWEAAGLYIYLLAWSWDNGPLPDDVKWRAKVIGKRSEKRWEVVRDRWTKTPHGYINIRLETQRESQRLHLAKSQKGAQKRWGRESGRELGIVQAYAYAMPRQASSRHMPKRCSASASASASADQNNPAPPAPVRAPTFKTYCAIAWQAFDEEPSDDLGAIAERFKTKCARQGFPYDATITTKALNAARAARARRRA